MDLLLQYLVIIWLQSTPNLAGDLLELAVPSCPVKNVMSEESFMPPRIPWECTCTSVWGIDIEITCNINQLKTLASLKQTTKSEDGQGE